MTDATADVLIQDARSHQAAMVEYRARARAHNQARDRLIRELRSTDPERWSYAKIAEAVGLTLPNVVKILRK